MISQYYIAAQHYFENSSLQKEHADELLDMLNVPEGGIVLDLGCGTGHLATVLSHLVGPRGKVVAVDPDADRISVAKKNNARQNVEYVIANDQSFPGEGYDLIVLNHVIHWIKDKRAAFNRIFSKLAPGGTLGVVTYDGTPTFPEAVSNGLSFLVSPDFEHNFFHKTMVYKGEQFYKTLASEIGFESTSAKIVSKELRFQSVSQFLDFWAGVSHGQFSTNDISKKKIETFTKKHENELLSSVTVLATMCMTFKKV